MARVGAAVCAEEEKVHSCQRPAVDQKCDVASHLRMPPQCAAGQPIVGPNASNSRNREMRPQALKWICSLSFRAAVDAQDEAESLCLEKPESNGAQQVACQGTLLWRWQSRLGAVTQAWSRLASQRAPAPHERREKIVWSLFLVCLPSFGRQTMNAASRSLRPARARRTVAQPVLQYRGGRVDVCGCSRHGDGGGSEGARE